MTGPEFEVLKRIAKALEVIAGGGGPVVFLGGVRVSVRGVVWWGSYSADSTEIELARGRSPLVVQVSVQEADRALAPHLGRRVPTRPRV